MLLIFSGMRMMPLPPGMMPPGMMRPPPMGRFMPPPPGRPPVGRPVHYPSQDPTRMGSIAKPGEKDPPPPGEDDL